MYEPEDGGYILWHAVLVNPVFIWAEKDERKKIGKAPDWP